MNHEGMQCEANYWTFTVVQKRTEKLIRRKAIKKYRNFIKNEYRSATKIEKVKKSPVRNWPQLYCENVI